MSKTANARYDAAHTTQIKLKLNLRTDADILRALEAQAPENGGKQGYIKRLIREDQARNSLHADTLNGPL